MTDVEFLRWIRNRLVNRYGDNKGVAHIIRLDKIINDMQEAQPDMGRST